MDNLKTSTVSVIIKGGLGNQLFQIAAAYVYAEKNHKELYLPWMKAQWDGRFMYWSSILFRCQPYVTTQIIESTQQWAEVSATIHTEIPITEDNLLLDGYFQSAKYFKGYETDIKELYRPSIEQIDLIKKRYAFLLENRSRVIVLHARRTDYLKNEEMIQIHGPLTPEYYRAAIQQMKESVIHPIFLLVSDDPTFWNTIDLSAYEYYMVANESDIHTFILMQQFHYFIIANSTFSWWAAWLADTKRVIAPAKWFGPKGPSDYEDIYEDSWERV